ncbi:hypothetical protein METEAL_23460 [Mesoterricola silvestris]|uniref:histidine kinase n=2 Tax=Mesoterricola silvestris TaxID=2927979 RepID=A0AA48GSG5_9BACT|nr:hypothetical protein METEAL_23460 [Mesoterricola silvestris]
MSVPGAILMFVLGLALPLGAMRSKNPLPRRLAALLTLGVLVAGLFLVAWRLGGHHPGPISAGMPGRPTSLLTGIVLSFGACSALVRLRSSTPGWSQRQAASVLAQIPLVIGTVVLVSYAAGAPLLYESQNIPMSLPSALCSVTLGIVLMLVAGFDTWPLAVFGFIPGRGNLSTSLWFATGPLAMFLLLGVLVLSGGSFFLRGQLKATRSHVQAELATIATFKSRQIESWFAERRTAAERRSHSALIQEPLRWFLEGSPQAPPSSQLLAWMEELQKGTYRRVVLFDAEGRVRLSAPAGAGIPVDDLDPFELAQALRSKDAFIRDIHQHPGSPDLHLSLWVPIGASPTPGGKAEGTLLLMIDPQELLFPLIRAWPTPSSSSEALLVRQDGSDLLFLNELRHRADPPMSLRMPLHGMFTAESLAAAPGAPQIVAGKDYRGEPVLAALSRIKGTPWSLVAKVDEAEIYAPLRRQIWLGGVVLIGMVVIVATGLGLMVRHHDAEMVRKQLDLSQRFEWLMREANDIILIMDSDGWIQEANSRALAFYGYTLQELKKMRVMELRSADTLERAQWQFDRLNTLGAIRFETSHVRKDGTTFQAEVSARVVHVGGEPIVITFVRDITERLAQEHELRRMNRLYSALGQVNHTIVWTDSREDLFSKICETLVEQGGFLFARIGWEEPGAGRIGIAGSFGAPLGCEDAPGDLEPMATAIRRGQPSVSNDIKGMLALDSGEKTGAGFASAAAFPISQGGSERGAIAVYSNERDIFGQGEIELLSKVAMDLSYALDNLESERLRREGEEALMASERFLVKAQEAGGIGTYKWDLLQDRWVSSSFLDRIFGIGPEYLRTLQGWLGLIAPEFRDQMQAYIARLIDQKEVFDLDYVVVRPSDGVRRWVHGQGEFEWDAEGHPVNLVGVIQDITEKKKDEETLRLISVAVEQSPLCVVVTDPAGTIQYVNPRFTHVTGYSPAEALGQNPRILKSHTTPPEHYLEMWETLTRGDVWVGEFQNLKKGGEPFHERATVAPVRDTNGVISHYIALKEDITRQLEEGEARRALEAQLQQSQKLESLGSLAGGVAHDMNNVLGAILGLASALREGAEAPSFSAKSLDTIMGACLRGRDVVKSLLYFAHKNLQEEQLFNLNDLVMEMSHLLSRTTLNRVQLRMDLQEGMDALRGDSGALSHMIMNLCVNAIDAMPHGGDLLITTRPTEDGGQELRVKDTGEGMAADVLAKAMEPFFSTKPKGKGTGLGLAMAYGTMKAHDGTLELFSQPGSGTEAVLRFPNTRVSPSSRAVPAASVQTPAALSNLRILLVDDDELIRDSLAPMLGIMGHRVTTAMEGGEALRLLGGGLEIDLVILDMNMPGMSGPEALPRILDLRPGLPVLMASGFSDQEIAPLLQDKQNVFSISKPFSMKEIQNKILEVGLRLTEISPS